MLTHIKNQCLVIFTIHIKKMMMDLFLIYITKKKEKHISAFRLTPGFIFLTRPLTPQTS